MLARHPEVMVNKTVQTPLRVLHWPSATGGNPQGLARAERAIGLQSWSILAQQHLFQYQADEVLLGAGENRLKLELKRWPIVWRALRAFDILHFNSGQSLMPQPVITKVDRFSSRWLWVYQWYTRSIEQRDLPLLKRAGKGIVVTYQGDDARQEDYCRTHFAITAATEVETGYYSAPSDEHKRTRIARFAQYADRIYALNPDLLHVLPPQARFLPYAHIDLHEWQPVARVVNDVPVVLHAPSHRGVKGTRFILAAIQRLQDEGVPLEFILVEGMSHADARKLYEKADLLIDQLLIGWYGGLAVELMALGKPVICYLRQDDLKFIPEAMRANLPIINAEPGDIYEVLKAWLTTRRYALPELGHRSRCYVERWHDPLRIAGYLKEEYTQIMQAKQKGSAH